MCYTPIAIKEGKRIVPCGNCVQCINSKSTAWYIRLKAEEKVCKNAYFITLTYDDKNNNGILRKKDLQDLFKRYRRKMANSEYASVFKYYAVGEYGTRTYRPHYHIIAFNVNIESLLIEWKFGFRSQGKLTEARIRYTTNYVINKHNYGKRLKYAPFAIMSKGLGQTYISDAIKKYHRENFSSVITFEGGTKLPMPRYLKEKIFGCETAIMLIGEKNRIRAQEKAKNTTYDKAIAERNYKREIFKRSKKGLTTNI